jgi:hypothetical protein
MSNCYAYNYIYIERDKIPGLLHPFSIPNRPWKHISMDFKSMPKDKGGFDVILVFVD